MNFKGTYIFLPHAASIMTDNKESPKLSSGMHGLSQWLLPVFLGKTDVGRISRLL